MTMNILKNVRMTYKSWGLFLFLFYVFCSVNLCISENLASVYTGHKRYKEVEQNGNLKTEHEPRAQSMLQWSLRGAKKGSSLLSADWRGGMGNVLAPMLDAVSPGSCIGELLSTGYTNDIHGEDDYPFMPRCNAPPGNDGIACFPRDASVWTPYGPKLMSDITIGTKVAVGFNIASKSLIFEPVAFFLHRDFELSPASWVKLYWENPNTNISGQLSAVSTLSLAPDHLVFVCNGNSERKRDCLATAAKRLAIGDFITTAISNQEGLHRSLRRIVDIEVILKGDSVHRGLFAPATSSGTLIVDGALVSQYSTFPPLASSFDSTIHYLGKKIFFPLTKVALWLRTPEIIEKPLNSIRSLIEICISGSWLLWNSSAKQFSHCPLV